MPEGPSIIILKEEVARFSGKTVVRASGVAAIDMKRLTGQRIVAFRSWGKHFLIVFPTFTVRIHFLLFGSHLIDARKPGKPKLRLKFTQGEINFYACAVKIIEGSLDDAYDWSADVLSDEWSASAARKKLRARPDLLACDALLNQDIFSGVGNIIKNEVLFRIRVHPLSMLGRLPAEKLRALVAEARTYSYEFLEWKKAGVLKQHWRVHTKTSCPRCLVPIQRAELGITRRRTFFCARCQRLYAVGRAKTRTSSRKRLAAR
jgi:endonuclease-8